MRVFLDTEFIEDGTTIDLLSIGLVREDGAELYLQSTDCRLEHASEWVVENVFPHLLALGWYGEERPLLGLSYFPEANTTVGEAVWRTRAEIAAAVREFVGPEPEFWAYYADYDWVALCQLYGRMIDLPEGWPMFCMDLKQHLVTTGRTAPPQEGTEHNALDDARWVGLAFAATTEET